MKEKNFDIKGMFCFYCFAAVVDGVRNLDGVKSVQIGFGKEAALVKYDSVRVSARQIEAAIRRCGFAVAPSKKSASPQGNRRRLLALRTA
jgi:copper chaperone CopZ